MDWPLATTIIVGMVTLATTIVKVAEDKTARLRDVNATGHYMAVVKRLEALEKAKPPPPCDD